jgi:hypothetical protein
MTKFKDDAYYKELDKRTKEYKLWKEFKLKQIENAPKGAGDVVEAITTATGIKTVVDTLFGDCGCGARKDLMNEKFPFRQKAVKCIEQEDYEYLQSFFSRVRTRLDATMQKRLVDIYNYVFDKREVVPSACINCSQKGFVKMVRKLEQYYKIGVEVATQEEEE